MPDDKARLFVIRHGETEWSRSGAHTSRTDLPLTGRGRELARRLGALLAGQKFAVVLTSPLRRARETCELAGYGDVAQIEPDLREWDYGDYEGRSTPEIWRENPHWRLWRDGAPNGENAEQVAERAQRVIHRAVAAPGDVALFSHGHILRVLAAVWTGLAPADGRLLALDTASIGVLGYERETRVISRWNHSVSVT
jgi:probable phosphoglycerate mutase